MLKLELNKFENEKKERINLTWPTWLSWLDVVLQSKGLLVRFPVRAHAWVAGLVPGWGCVRGNRLIISLTH